MGKVLQKLTALLLCVMIVVPFMSFTTSAEEGKSEKTFDVDSIYTQSYTYEYKGFLYLVSYDPYTNEISVTQLTKNLEMISKKQIISELPEFGGFFSGKSYNYIVFGQNNFEEDPQKETFRIVKYDKEFNKISQASINGESSQTCIPFDAGDCNFAESGNELTIHTAREYFTLNSDGLNHQAQFTIVLNTDTMTPINKLGFFQDNHVSHSFGQFVKYDNGKRVLIDHGDAYPRSVFLQRYEGTDNYGREKYTEVNLFEMPGEIGQNYTGVSVGGFEISENNYIVAISSIYKNNSELKSQGYNDVALLICDKNNPSEENTKTVYLTNHIEDNKSVSYVKLVKLSENRFAVQWLEYDSEYYIREIKYVLIDENGQEINPIKTIDSFDFSIYQISQPIFLDNKLIYVYNHHDNETVVSYSISSDLLCNHSVVMIPAKAATCSETGNQEHYKCSECGFCFEDANATIPQEYNSVIIDCIPHHSNTPLCQKNGNVCVDCGITFTAKGNHAPGEITELDKTNCTQWGVDECICSECNELFYQYHQSLGHTFESFTVVTEPTCETEGELYGYCTTCKKTVTDKIPEVKHTPGECELIQEATCKRVKIEKTTCQVCDYVYYIETPENGHPKKEEWDYECEPTCQKWGYKQRNCSECKDTILMEYTAPTGHELGEWITIETPTAEKAGEKVKICSVCSCIVEREAIPVTEIPEDACTNHTPSEEWETIIEAGCFNRGLKINKCATCNCIISNETIDYLYHNYEKVVISKPTCISEGKNKYICTRCGYLGWTSETNKISCSIGGWETVTEPNCGNPGQKVRKCTMCGKIMETAEIPALDTHSPGEWETVTESTCTVAGEMILKCTGCKETIDTRSIPVKEHNMGDWQIITDSTCKDEGEKVKICKDCGTQAIKEAIPVKAHSVGDWVITKEAECGVDGEKAKFCNVCNTKTETEIIEAVEHIESDWIVQRAASCSKEGIQIKKCLNCDKEIISEKIPKTEHTPKKYWSNISSPTCTEDGLKILKCSVCDETIDSLVLAANGHKSGEWEITSSATCNGAGERIKKCTVCGEITIREPIGAEGHTPAENWVVITPATCTAEGKKIKKCTVCGLAADSQDIPALGHDPESEWVITKDATCTENGIKTCKCTRCEYTVTEEIAAKGHSKSNWYVTVTADCTNSGKKIKKCSVCGITTDSAVIPATGHISGEWEVIDASSCIKEGTRIKRCTECNATLQSESLPYSSHTKGNWVVTKTPANGTYGIKAKFCTGCGIKLEEKIIYSVSSETVKDNSTGIEIVYVAGSFDGDIAVKSRAFTNAELSEKINEAVGDCRYTAFEAILVDDGIQLVPSGSYSVRIPVPYGYDYQACEVYGIDISSGKLYKVSATYENGYFLIEKADAIQYAVVEKIYTLSLSETNLKLNKGDAVQLIAYTNGKSVTYTSSDTSVATVDINGNVKAVGNGTAVITAAVDGTSVKQECSVEVSQSFFEMIIAAITEAFSSIIKALTDAFKSINGSISAK